MNFRSAWLQKRSERGILDLIPEKLRFFRKSLTVWICRFDIVPTSPGLTPSLRFEAIEEVNQHTSKKDREDDIPIGSRPIKGSRGDDEDRPFENPNTRRLDSRRAGNSNLPLNNLRPWHLLDRVRREWKRKQSSAGGEAYARCSKQIARPQSHSAFSDTL